MAWLWFFFIGLVIYWIHLPFVKKNERILFWAFVGSGTLAAAAASCFGAGDVAAAFHIPAGLIVLTGALAGSVIFWFTRNKWFEKFWLRFFLTPLLGMILAAVLFVVFVAYSALRKTTGIIVEKPLLVFFTFFLMALLTAFGYTFPERWFAKKEK